MIHSIHAQFPFLLPSLHGSNHLNLNLARFPVCLWCLVRYLFLTLVQSLNLSNPMQYSTSRLYYRALRKLGLSSLHAFRLSRKPCSFRPASR